MLNDSQSIANESQAASHADYAAADFESCMTAEEAHKFGGEVLADHCIDMRLAAVVMSKGKKELVEGLGQDKEVLMTTIERLQYTEKFIKALADMNERAVTRLLSVACTVMDENGEGQSEKSKAA